MGGAALHLGNIAEMKTGEGKTLVVDAAGVPQRADRQGRPPRHGQRLPGRARRRVDGPRPPVPRADRSASILAARCARRAARGSTPATSPTARTTSSASTTCATTWRGSSDELVQRGHNFAIVDEVDSILIDEARTPLIISGPGRRRPRSGTPSSPGSCRGSSGDLDKGVDGDYEVDEKKRTVGILESGVAQGRGLARHREPLRVGQHPARRLPEQRAQGQGAVQARQGLRRHGRRGHDRRRVHRPHPRRPALQRGHAPGDRGQGGGGDQGGEPDPRHDHAAELLPPLRQALRHDRHGHDRGRRVRPDLQARRRADPDEPAAAAATTRPTSSTAPRTPSSTPSSTTSPSGTSTASPSSSAPPASRSPSTSRTCSRKRGVPHEVLNAKQHEREAAIVAQAGRKGAVTVATNMAGRGTDIMLGGNPEFMAAAELRQRGLVPGGDARGVRGGLAGRAREGEEVGRGRARRGQRARRPLRAGHRAARVAAASTTSCAAGPAVRATRARRRFYLSLEDDLMRLFKADMVDCVHGAGCNVPDDVPIEAKMVTRGHRVARRRRSRRRTSRSARTSSSTTRS